MIDESWRGVKGVVPTISRHFSVDEQLYLIGAAMVMWGFASGVFNGPAQALFADSLPLGERSKWYSYLAMCYMLPGVGGPAIAIVLLKTYGNTHWVVGIRRPGPPRQRYAPGTSIVAGPNEYAKDVKSLAKYRTESGYPWGP